MVRWLTSFSLTLANTSTIDEKVIELDSYDTDVHGVAYVFVRHGLIPCAPLEPTVGFTIRTLEAFRVLQLRCPRLSIQAFTKALATLNIQRCRSYHAEQLSIAYDLYLQILGQVSQRTAAVLGRESADWRLKNACPSCTYRLQDEPQLRFSMLACMDGNESAWRLARRKQDENEEGKLGPVNERTDSRTVDNGYWLSRETVDRWAKGSTSILPLSQVSSRSPAERERPCWCFFLAD